MDMVYRNMGKTGLKLSALSLGGWTTFGGSLQDRTAIKEILFKAFESGVNFFDIADIYAQGRCESEMGLVLKEFPRHELVISSKVFWPMSKDVNDCGLSRKHIMESIHNSLKRIGTDYLDIYFCHRFDENTPVEETAKAMDDLIHQGKVLYWGTSEWSAAQIEEVWRVCDKYNLYPPMVEQPQYNLLTRKRLEEEVRPVATELGMGLVVWSPLASGLLSGKYDAGLPEGTRLAQIEWLKEQLYTEGNLEKVKSMKALAEDCDCSRSQLALAWALAQPGISSVITGATSVNQLSENLKSLETVLTQDLDQKLKNLFTY